MPTTRAGAVLGWSRKADPDAVVLFSALEDQASSGNDDVETIWHLDLEAPHNLVA